MRVKDGKANTNTNHSTFGSVNWIQSLPNVHLLPDARHERSNSLGTVSAGTLPGSTLEQVVFESVFGFSKVACAVSGGPQPGPPGTPVGWQPVVGSSQPQLWVLLCQAKPVIVIGWRIWQSEEDGLVDWERTRRGRIRARRGVLIVVEGLDRFSKERVEWGCMDIFRE